MANSRNGFEKTAKTAINAVQEKAKGATKSASEKIIDGAERISAVISNKAPTDTEKLDRLFATFDEAYKLIFGEDYAALERADKTFEYKGRQYYISYSPSIKCK